LSGLILIAWDSADWRLVRRWTEAGELPALAGLMARGGVAELDSTADAGSGTVWASLFTGVQPAKHGSAHARRLERGSYRVTHEARAAALEREPFWLPLSRAGRRVALVDLPKTRPEPALNGIALIGWGAHSPSWPPDATPRALLDEVRARFGDYGVADCDEFIPSGAAELTAFYRSLLSGVEKKTAVALALLAREPWDLFCVNFSEPHCAGHNFWHLMDPAHPAHDARAAAALGDAILQVYRRVDAAAARLIEARPDAAVLVVSPEGMGPNYTGSHLLPEVLRRLGAAAPATALARLSPAGRWGPHAVRNLRSLLPRPALKAIERVKRAVPTQTWMDWKARLMTLGNDWSASRAFCVPSDFNGAVRVNLAGREPAGRVAPGAEYDALCDELARELAALVNAATGEAAVEEVVRVDRRYPGPFRDDLPDLIVKWRGDAPIRALASPRIGTVAGANHHERTGAHRSYGFLVAAGGPFRAAGACAAGAIMDVAPTVLQYFGLPAPPDLDGRARLDLLEGAAAAHEPRG
jgi:predicted AlkP superfamily phosphohydrolase/phosphomutase